jgi:hypothetical protein
MDANERGRKRRETAAPETADSVPPPRRTKVRNELDPEMLWDKETDEDSEELEDDEEGFDSEESEASDDFSEDLDDWDHPIRRLKIN